VFQVLGILSYPAEIFKEFMGHRTRWIQANVCLGVCNSVREPHAMKYSQNDESSQSFEGARLQARRKDTAGGAALAAEAPRRFRVNYRNPTKTRA